VGRERRRVGCYLRMEVEHSSIFGAALLTNRVSQQVRTRAACEQLGVRVNPSATYPPRRRTLASTIHSAASSLTRQHNARFKPPRFFFFT